MIFWLIILRQQSSADSGWLSAVTGQLQPHQQWTGLYLLVLSGLKNIDNVDNPRGQDSLIVAEEETPK